MSPKKTAGYQIIISIKELKAKALGTHTVCVPRGGDIKIKEGTKFQRKVWSEISKIPFGKTISYKELARRIGRPKSCRAVANACGANPYPVKIPCHRVIASDGSIGGFSLGVKKKIALLKKEGVTFPQTRRQRTIV